MLRISIISALFAFACSSEGPAGDPQELFSDSGSLLGVFDPDGAPRVGTNHIAIDLYSGEHAVEGAIMEVEPWMPHHGHGSPRPTVMTVDEDGYDLEVYFNMAGHWELHVSVQTELGDDSFLVPIEVR